jgi:hypothetical protein
MNEASQVPLAQLLRDAAQELDTHPVPPLRPWQPAANEPMRPRRMRFSAWFGAAACALVVLASGMLMLGGGLPRGDDAPMQARGSDFLPLAPPERWTQLGRDGADAAWLVTTEMPRDRLAALGLPFDPSRAGESVRAEVLMHPSGEVLAVRFLR